MLPLFRPQAEIGTLEEFDLRRIAEESGCDVIETHTLNAAGRVVLVLELDCRNNENAIKFLNGAARRDAWDPRVVDVVARILRPLGTRASAGVITPAIMAFVKQAVAFRREKDERFQHSLITLAWRIGDCDDHARLVAALLFAAGLEARIVGVMNSQGRMVHVCAQVKDERGAWRWAETTVDAEYGEEPRAAAHRLSVAHVREDLSG